MPKFNSSLFRGMRPEAVNKLLSFFETRTYSAGSAICLIDDPGNELFVLATGTAAVKLARDDQIPLGPGDVIGEMTLFEEKNTPRSATVLCTSDVQALVLSKDKLRRMEQVAFANRDIRLSLALSGMQKNVIRIISTRLCEANAILRGHARTIHKTKTQMRAITDADLPSEETRTATLPAKILQALNRPLFSGK